VVNAMRVQTQIPTSAVVINTSGSSHTAGRHPKCVVRVTIPNDLKPR
jgi:hypothetical protein